MYTVYMTYCTPGSIQVSLVTSHRWSFLHPFHGQLYIKSQKSHLLKINWSNSTGEIIRVCMSKHTLLRMLMKMLNWDEQSRDENVHKSAKQELKWLWLITKGTSCRNKTEECLCQGQDAFTLIRLQHRCLTSKTACASKTSMPAGLCHITYVIPFPVTPTGKHTVALKT